MKRLFPLLLCLGLLNTSWAAPPAPTAETGAAHRALADALDAKKDVAGAIAELQKAFTLDSAKRLPEATLDLNSIGEELYGQSRYADALGYFQKALALTHGTGSKNEAIALSDIGMTQGKLGRNEESLAAHRQALLVSQGLKDRSQEANTQYNIGNMLLALRRMDEAADAWTASLDIFHALPDAASEESVAGNAASALYDAKLYALAARFYSRLLVCLNARGDRKGAAATLTNLGACAGNLHQYSQAADFYMQATVLRHAENDASGEQDVVSRLASALFDAARYSEATEAYSRLAVFQRGAGDKKGEMLTLDNLGATSLRLHQNEKALDFYQQALALRRALTGSDRNADDEAVSLKGVITASIALRRYDRALALYGDLRSLKPQGDADVEAALLDVLADAHQSPRNGIGVKSQTAVLNAQTSAAALNAQGLADVAAKRYEKAIRNYRRALELMPSVEAYALNLASALNRAKRFSEAILVIESNLAAFPAPADRKELLIEWAEAHYGLGKAWDARKSWADALPQYQAAYSVDRIARRRDASLDLHCAAMDEWKQHRFEDAQKLFGQSAEISHEIGDLEGEAVSMGTEAHVLSDLGQDTAAIDILQKALEICRVQGLRSDEADVLRDMGDSARVLSRYSDAMEWYRQSLEIFQELGDLHSAGILLSKMGVACDRMSRFADAQGFYDQALTLQQAGHDSAEEANTLSRMGETFDSQNRYAEAIRCFHQALALHGPDGKSLEQAMPLSALATTFGHMGRHHEAVHLNQEVLAIYRRERNLGGEAACQNNLAANFASLGEYDQAVNSYKQALAIHHAMGDRASEAITLNNLGNLYSTLNQTSKALDLFEQALVIQRTVGDREGEAVTLDNEAGIFAGAGAAQPAFYDRAETLYQQVLSIHRETGSADGEAVALNNLGSLNFHRHRAAEARKFYELALASYQRIGDRDGESVALTNLAVLTRGQNQPVQAAEYYAQALAISVDTGDKDGAQVTWDNLMTLAAENGNPAWAIYCGKQSVNILQSLRGNLKSFDKGVQKNYLEAHSHTYHYLAELLIHHGRLDEAQQVLEMLKEEEFFDFLGRDPSAARTLTASATLTPFEADWQGRFQKATGRAAFLGDMAHTFQVPASATQLAAPLRKTLPIGTVAVYTIVAPDKLFLIVTTPAGQVARESPIKADDLYRKVLTFRNALQDPTRDPRPLAQDLYKIIVGPIEADLKAAHAATLLWSLDDALRYLPISALHDGKSYLVERYDNCVLTLAAPAQTAPAPTSAAWTGLGLGVSRQHPGFDALPGVRAELSGIIGPVVPGQTLLDAQFTQAAFLAGLKRRNHPLIHIASHFALSGRDTDSFLLLGDGGHLSMAQMKADPNVFAGVDLLTLSACNTAMEVRSAGGKEVEGFGALAQRLGARSVLASLWPVADASTPVLMREFYRLRRSNPKLSKAADLRQAQRELLHGQVTASSAPSKTNRAKRAKIAGAANTDLPLFVADPKAPYAHPYYWAPFVLIGNPR